MTTVAPHRGPVFGGINYTADLVKGRQRVRR